ncbi:hypothetical protein [Kribbella aluminosa]|uniref:hypothetical protein n=1 Tax=Kribbella aluminosa TaxID=416017 RepID=UPI0027DB9333|nr:hypothetical protein [Kribbella aluminosa]
MAWHPEDVLKIYPHDAEVHEVTDGDVITLSSRVGRTVVAEGNRWAAAFRRTSGPPTRSPRSSPTAPSRSPPPPSPTT